MKKLQVALVCFVMALAFGLTGCGGKKKSDKKDDKKSEKKKGDKQSPVVSKYTAMVGKICKCKDQACADQLGSERKTLKAEYKNVSKGDEKKLEELDKKWNKCRADVAGVRKKENR